jgi:hypothetical protein
MLYANVKREFEPEEAGAAVKMCGPWRVNVSTTWNLYRPSSHFAEDELFASLPENFAWILEYVSAAFGCDPVDVYYVMQEAERIAVANDRSYYGVRSMYVQVPGIGRAYKPTKSQKSAYDTEKTD